MILHSSNYSAQLNQSKSFCSPFLFYENIWIKLKYFVIFTLWHDAHLDDNILSVQRMMIVLKRNMIRKESVAIFLAAVSHHIGTNCKQSCTSTQHQQYPYDVPSWIFMILFTWNSRHLSDFSFRQLHWKCQVKTARQKWSTLLCITFGENAICVVTYFWSTDTHAWTDTFAYSI